MVLVAAEVARSELGARSRGTDGARWMRDGRGAMARPNGDGGGRRRCRLVPTLGLCNKRVLAPAKWTVLGTVPLVFAIVLLVESREGRSAAAGRSRGNNDGLRRCLGDSTCCGEGRSVRLKLRRQLWWRRVGGACCNHLVDGSTGTDGDAIANAVTPALSAGPNKARRMKRRRLMTRFGVVVPITADLRRADNHGRRRRRCCGCGRRSCRRAQ